MKRALIIFCIAWTILTILLIACSPSLRSFAASRSGAGIEHIKTRVAADELRTFDLSEKRGELTTFFTYWFRGDQCIACIRGSSDNQMNVQRPFAYLDIFHAGNRIAEWDLQRRKMLFVNVPEGITFRMNGGHFTIHSKDFSYFEQIFLQRHFLQQGTNWASQVIVPITSVLIADREAFKARLQHIPAKQLLPLGTPLPGGTPLWLGNPLPHEEAPALEEIRARAEKKSE